MSKTTAPDPNTVKVDIVESPMAEYVKTVITNGIEARTKTYPYGPLQLLIRHYMHGLGNRLVVLSGFTQTVSSNYYYDYITPPPPPPYQGYGALPPVNSGGIPLMCSPAPYTGPGFFPYAGCPTPNMGAPRNSDTLMVQMISPVDGASEWTPFRELITCDYMLPEEFILRYRYFREISKTADMMKNLEGRTELEVERIDRLIREVKYIVDNGMLPVVENSMRCIANLFMTKQAEAIAASGSVNYQTNSVQPNMACFDENIKQAVQFITYMAQQPLIGIKPKHPHYEY